MLGFLGLLLASCSGLPGGRSFEDGLDLIKATCFEVVAEKPTMDSLTYDRPLSFELLNYNVRTDKYLPLGTAFAINAEELVTAAHVLSLTSDSMVYKTRFIREKLKEGGKTIERVYEINDIRAFSNNRDYVVFTVKGRKFDRWLRIENAMEFNKKVYTAGDAYGEGIVVRDGVLLDEVPEEENASWNYLKSSIATNPGNSGGPLLNGNFDVIGIVLSRKDDFCYSLPMKEIVPGKALLHNRTSLGFSVFSKRSIKVFESAFDLPMPYADLTKKSVGGFREFYRREMDGLFAENKEDIFPEGRNSEKALNRSVDSIFPQIYLQDTTSGSWFSSDLETSGADIGDDGALRLAEIYKDQGIWLMLLDKPKSVSVRELWDNSKAAMDLILKGINITRKLTESDQGSRVLSYGKPLRSIPHTDRYGRIWRIDVFLLEYSDQFVMTCSLPLPRGLAMIYIARSSSQSDEWIYDLGKLTDFVNVSYSGTLKEWDTFMKHEDFKLSFMKNVSVTFQEGSFVDVDTRSVSVRVPQGLVGITEKASLFLGSDVFLKNGKPVMDIRKLVLTQESGSSNNYLTYYRWAKPTDSLPETIKDSWKKNVLERGHPYGGGVYSEDGRTNIGTIHPSYLADGKANVPSDFAYTVFASGEGSVPEAEMKKYLRDFADGMKIKE